MMNKSFRIIIVALFIAGFVAAVILYKQSGYVKFSVLKAPAGFVIKADSAGYLSKDLYQIKVVVINNTKKPVTYMPVTAMIRDQGGRKIGLVNGNTGEMLKASATKLVVLQTIIPKTPGKPAEVIFLAE